MSDAQEGIVKKVYQSDKPRGGCTVYIQGVEGGLYCNAPNKAEDFNEGDTVRWIVKKPAGKGYAVDKIRVVTPEEMAEREQSAPKVVATATPPPAATTKAEPSYSVRSSATADSERQRMIIVQSCQKVAVDMLKIYMEKEAFTLGAAVNKRKAVIDAFFNGLVYDLYQQVVNGPVALEGKPEDAKPVPKAKKAKAAGSGAVEESPADSAEDDAVQDMDDLP